MRPVGRILLLFGLAATTITRAPRDLPTLRPSLDDAPAPSVAAFWVYLDGTRFPADVREALPSRVRVRTFSRWLRAFSVDASSLDTAAVAATHGVRGVRPCAVARASGVVPAPRTGDAPARPSSDPYGNARAQLERIGVPGAHAAGLTGNGIRIAVLDTGFRRDHESLRGLRIVAQHDFLHGDGDTQNGPDEMPAQQEHGTLVWAACGGRAPGTHMGPAFGAEYLLCKTEDPSMEFRAEEDYFVAALEWADSMRADIVTSSLAFTTFTDGSGYSYEDLDGDTAAATRALDVACSRGILCFQGAGNSGPLPGSLIVPADADSIVACGAVDPANRIAPFSSRGPTADGRIKPDVCAPGMDVWSADAAGPKRYASYEGTSLATPLCAGAAALVWEAHPEWSAAEVRAAMLATADRAHAPDNIVGHGTIDAARAIDFAPVVVPGPFSAIAPAGPDSVDPADATFTWERPRLLPEGEVSFELWVEAPGALPGEADARIVVPGILDTTVVLATRLRSKASFRWTVWAVAEGEWRRGARSWLSFSTRADTSSSEQPLAGPAIRVRPIPSRALPVVEIAIPSGGGVAVDWDLVDVAGRRLAAGRVDGGVAGRWIRLELEDGGGMRARSDLPDGVYWVRATTRDTGASMQERVVLLR